MSSSTNSPIIKKREKHLKHFRREKKKNFMPYKSWKKNIWREGYIAIKSTLAQTRKKAFKSRNVNQRQSNKIFLLFTSDICVEKTFVFLFLYFCGIFSFDRVASSMYVYLSFQNCCAVVVVVVVAAAAVVVRHLFKLQCE